MTGAPRLGRRTTRWLRAPSAAPVRALRARTGSRRGRRPAGSRAVPSARQRAPELHDPLRRTHVRGTRLRALERRVASPRGVVPVRPLEDRADVGAARFLQHPLGVRQRGRPDVRVVGRHDGARGQAEAALDAILEPLVRVDPVRDLAPMTGSRSCASPDAAPGSDRRTTSCRRPGRSSRGSWPSAPRSPAPGRGRRGA